MGLKVSSIKIDPYINVDAGLMNPREHGECYVLNDGGEVDLDLGEHHQHRSSFSSSETDRGCKATTSATSTSP